MRGLFHPHAIPTDQDARETIRFRAQTNTAPRKTAPHSNAAHNPRAPARNPATPTAARTAT